MSFKITWKTHMVCFFISGIIALLLWDTANVIIENFIMQVFIHYPTKFIIVNFYIVILLLLVPIIAVHEALHGIAYIVFGGKVRYGFIGIYSYTKDVFGKVISRNKFLIVLILSLTIMSVITCLFAVG